MGINNVLNTLDECIVEINEQEAEIVTLKALVSVLESLLKVERLSHLGTLIVLSDMTDFIHLIEEAPIGDFLDEKER